MKKKYLLLLSTILLSSCHYNPFNFISIEFPTYEQLVQKNEYLFFKEDSNANFYQLFVEDDDDYKFLCSSTAYGLNILEDIGEEYIGKKMYYNGYNLDLMEYDDNYLSKPIPDEPLFISSKIKLYRPILDYSSLNSLTVDKSERIEVDQEGSPYEINVDSSIEALYLKNLECAYRVEIEQRETDLHIFFDNVHIENGYFTKGSAATINYQYDNDVDFYIHVESDSSISRCVNDENKYGAFAINLPSIIFDAKSNSKLTVTGGRGWTKYGTSNDYPTNDPLLRGLAIKANHIYNAMPATNLNLVGGKGTGSMDYYYSFTYVDLGGNNGSIPINVDVEMRSLIPFSIALLSGDGGNGGHGGAGGHGGNGGDVYSFTYMRDYFYPINARYITSGGFPTPGQGGGSGIHGWNGSNGSIL